MPAHHLRLMLKALALPKTAVVASPKFNLSPEATMSRLLQILALCALFFSTTLTTACGGDEDAKKGKKAKKAKKNKKAKNVKKAKKAKTAKKAKKGKKAGKKGKKAGKMGKKAKAGGADKSTAPKCKIKGLKSCQKDTDCLEACVDNCCRTSL
jgi:hypothetical protein